MTEEPGGTRDRSSAWDADLYEARHGFVHEAAADLVEFLDPDPGEQVLDLGCGTGHLTADLRDRGAVVVGLDHSPEMLTEARERYPNLSVVQGDARALPFDGSMDAVFSNATLHWVPPADAERAARAVRATLQPGGRFVAELGGHGNVETITQALLETLRDHGHDPRGRNPWYFPSVAEYAGVLEAVGLEVRYARLFDRPTPLDGGSAGLRNWVSMFAESFLAGLGPTDREAVLTDLADRLHPTLFEDGTWVADYRRLRVVAVRETDGE